MFVVETRQEVGGERGIRGPCRESRVLPTVALPSVQRQGGTKDRAGLGMVAPPGHISALDAQPVGDPGQSWEHLSMGHLFNPCCAEQLPAILHYSLLTPNPPGWCKSSSL